MATIKEENWSETRKRVDTVVTTGGFLSRLRTWNVRIVSGKEIPAGEGLGELVEQVFERKGDWRKGKKVKFLPLNGLRATAYIEEVKEEKPATEDAE